MIQQQQQHKTTGLGDGDSIDEKEQLKQDIINRLLLSI